MGTTPIKVIITGTTGMVGEGVLHVCLEDERISEILVINRRPCGVSHPKLKEVIHADFFDLSPIAARLTGYDACFFCLGISSVGVSKDDYFRMTYTLTLHFGGVLSRQNPGMVFEYISGKGTDSTEKGRSHWARVKGKTENDLMKLPFRKVFGVRPGFIKPIPGLKHTHSFYKYINWMFYLGRPLSPGSFCTLPELARCMIRAATEGYSKNILEGADIIELGKR